MLWKNTLSTFWVTALTEEVLPFQKFALFHVVKMVIGCARCAALLCVLFRFNWSQQTKSFWFSMHVSFHHTLQDMVYPDSVHPPHPNLQVNQLSAFIPQTNDWYVCWRGTSISLSLPEPALAHSLLVYQPAKAIKLMPSINTLLSGTLLLPGADENYSSWAYCLWLEDICMARQA